MNPIPLSDPEPAPPPAAARPPTTPRWPAWLLACGAAVVLGFVIQSILICMRVPQPLNPWESAIVIDAWRAAQGITVYQMPDMDRATHMYGPLVTYLNAAVYLVTGPTLRGPRAVSLSLSVVLAVVMALVFARRGGLAMRFTAIVLVFAQLYRTRASYAEARPDVLAALMSLVALILIYRGHERRSWVWTAFGCAAAILALLSKQTAAAVAAVPIGMLLFQREYRRPMELLRAATPMLCIIATLLIIRLAFPAVWFHMIEIPRRFELRPTHWQMHFFSIFSYNALFLLALGAFLLDPGRRSQRVEPMVRWILMTCVILAITCTLAIAKRGGAVNSWLPLFLCCTAFTIIMLPRLLRIAGQWAPRWATVAVVGILLLALYADMIGVAGNLPFTRASMSHGDRNYWRIVQRMRELEGKVISPDDPTLAFFASGYIGRSFHCELDSTGNYYAPEPLKREIGKAKYLVRVEATWDVMQRKMGWPIHGFRRVRDPAFEGTRYSLWVRPLNRADARQPTTQERED